MKCLGEILKRPTRTDCKSVGFHLRRFESCSPHIALKDQTLKIAGVAQLVERQPSKLNVAGSNPVSRSSIYELRNTIYNRKSKIGNRK